MARRFEDGGRTEIQAEGCWTDESHGLAFCYDCLDEMSVEYGPVEDIEESPVREDGYTAPVCCENCGVEIRKLSKVE